jgi:hypothetical protein
MDNFMSHMDIVCHISLSHSEVVCHIRNPITISPTKTSRRSMDYTVNTS